MEDISLPHDTRVEDILADYFTKKIEGKDAEAKEKHSDSQHSSKSKKSKKRKHKKKKKHKSRKAHSENEEEERAHSSADECWVEVTAGKDKENSAKDKSDTTDKEPKKKQKSKSKRRDASASSNVDAAVTQDAVTSKDKGGTCKDEDRGGKGDTVQKEPATKDDVKQAEHTGRTSRRSSVSTSPARSKRASSSSDSDDDHKSASAAEPASHASKAEPAKKPAQKKGRSYRTKRCRSSGSSDSSEDDQDKQSRSRSRSLSQGESPRPSRQNRARSSSRSRRGTRSKDLRQERSKSRDDGRYDRSRDRSRSPKRSSPIRSQRRGQSRSRLSRSPGRSGTGRSHSRRRSQGRHSRSPRRSEGLRGRSPRRSEVIRNRSPRRTEGRRSRSPRRTDSHRSRSPRRPESRRSPSPSRGRGWSGSKQSRGRTPPRRSPSRKRSVSRQRGRRSQSPSSKNSRRSTSRDKRHERKSQSPKGERKSRSRSRKRSVSKQRRSSRHSSSGDNSPDRSKSNERDKKSEEKASSARPSTPDKSSASSVDEDGKEKRSKSAEEKTKQGKVSDKESSVDGGKNQVVLYGPFEEEEASFDEEPSPDRAESTTKPTQPETGSGGAGKNVKNQPATSSLDAVPLPAEPAAQSEDTQLEDMDISDSPSSGGVLEVEDSLSQSLPSHERRSSPSVTSRHQTETRALQQCVPPQKVPTSEEMLAKAAPARAAIPWTYAEMQPPPPPPWLKPEVTKPVGQVRPFVREVNPSELAAQKSLLQGRQDGVGAVGSLATVQPSTDPPLITPDKSTYKTEELSALASPAAKAAQQSAFPDVSAKLIPQISLATVPPPPVNVHSGALYSATVMPVHVPYQFMGLPGHGQVGPGTTLPVPQEKSAHMTEQQHEQRPPQPQQSRDNQPSDSVDSTGTAPQLSGPPGSESNPSSPTKKSEVASTAPDVGAAEEAKDGNGSVSSSRSSSPAEGRSRSSSKERLNSRTSRSHSRDREATKRSRSSESRSPSSDTKRLRKDDRADSEEKRTKKESRDRHDSASPDRSARDSHARKKSASPDRKQSKTHDRKRSKSRDRRRSKSRDRRSKSRDRRRSQSRDRKKSPMRERRRSKSHDRRPSKSRERRRSKSRERKRSKSKDRKRSRSRERKRSKSRERKRSKSRDRRRSKSRDRRRSLSRDRKRSKSRERRTSVGRSGTRSARRRSASRSRRSRSHDQTKRRSQSRERVRQRRSQSKERDSSRRKSRDREAPRGGLILKRYKNELSSESDSSPERKSKAKPSSPVKKRQRRDSDAESVSSQDDKPQDNRAASPMSETGEPDAESKGDDCTHSEKVKELEKQRPSERESKDKDAPYGPLPPNEAITSPAPKEPQHSHDEMDDERDVPAGSDISSSLGTKADNKALHTPVVSSSSSKENISAGDTSLASSKGQSAGHSSFSDSTVRRSPEPKQDRQDRSINKGDKLISEKLTIPSGESAVSSSTGSPGQSEEQPKSSGLSGDLNTENISRANSSSVRGPSACLDSNDDGEKKPSTTTGDKAKETSYSDDTRSTSDNGRKSRSRSPSSTSSIERARTRKESSSSSSSPSPERGASKEPSKSRSTSPDSPDRETRDESPAKKSRSRETKRSRSREKKRSKSREKRGRSREKKRSHSREKKRSLSREKKRSKSRERRMSRSRDTSRRSKERKRSRSREKKRSPSREKRRSRSREKRRSRSRDKRRSRSRDRKQSPIRDKRRSRSREKKRSISRDRRRSRSRDKRRSRSRDKRRSLSRDRRRSRERRRSRDRKSPSRSRDRRRSRERRPRSRSRPRRSWSRAMELQRKRSAERLRKKSRSPRKRSVSKRRSPPPRKKSRSRSRRRSRTHSPPERKRKSRSRERMLPQGRSDQQGVLMSQRNRESREPSVVKVDKAQLLEAARKNMQAMLQRGVVAKGLPVAAAAAVNATVKVVAAAVAAAAADPRSSLAAKLDVASSATSTPPNEPPVLPLAQSGDGTGPAVTLGMTEEPPKIKRSLAALTEICRAISDEEKREYAGEVEPKTAEEVAEEFQQTHHHPFKLKEPPPPIRFNIPNATNLPVKTLAEKVADAAHLHKQFPVSSGNQHRVKELEWVPVEKTEPAPAPKAARAAKSRAAPSTEGGTSPLALMPPPLPKTETFSPLPTVATPPVFQVEDVPLPVSSAVISSTVTEPPDPAPAEKEDTAKIDKGTALLKAKGELPKPDGQASGGNKDKDRALDHNTEGESPPGESNSLLNDSLLDKTAEAKHENVDESQHSTQCDAFADDANPTFPIEEVPLESIPLPEGPYIPPEMQQSQLPGSLDHQDETSASVQDINSQSQKARKSSNCDNAPEQRLSKKAVLNDIKDIKETISESSTKATAKPEIETKLKSVKRDGREPTAKIKNREVTPSKRRPSTETKEPPKPELSSQSNSPASRKSELDIRPKMTRTGELKNKEKTPSIGKVEQHPSPEVLQEADKVVEPKQAPEPTDMRSKLQKLRRESIMSMLKFEPLEITQKTVPIQSLEMKQDGASLCKQAWSRISASQKESAYFSSENKKASPEPARPVQNKKEDSAEKTELCSSQSMPKAKNPSLQMEKKPTTTGQGGTMAGQRECNRFLHRQIQENVITQPLLGYQTFGNMIVNPAPPVQPPERDQANSSPAKASGAPPEKFDKNTVAEVKQESKALPASFAAEVSSAVQKQPKENSVTPKEANRHSDTDFKRSRSNVHSASTTANRVVSDTELSAKHEAKDGNKKTSKGEHGELPAKSQEHKQGRQKEDISASTRVDASVTKPADAKSTKGQEIVQLPSSKSVPHKQTRDNTPTLSKESAKKTQDSTPTLTKEPAKKTQDSTPTRSRESAKHVQKQVSVAKSAPKTDSRAALFSKNDTPSHKTKSDILHLQQEQIRKAESSPKPNEKIAATQVSEVRDSKSDSTSTQSKESAKHIQEEVLVPKIAPKNESRPASSTKRETPSCHTKSQNILPQQHEQLRKAELSRKPNEKVSVPQVSESRDSKRASTSTQSKESDKHIPKHVSNAKTALKRESHAVSSTKKETPSRHVKSENLLPPQQEQIHKAGSSQKACEKVAVAQVSKLQDKVLLSNSKSMPHKQTQDSTPTQSKEPAKHTPKHVVLTKVAPERHSHAALSLENEVPSHQTKLQNLLPLQEEEKHKAGLSPKPNKKTAATQMSGLQDKGDACQHTKSTVAEAQQDQISVKPKERTATPLKESTAPGKAVTQHRAASTPTSPSNKDKTGESEQASVVQHMHHGTDVIHEPNNESLALTQSTTSSVEELDGATHKRANSTEPVTPVHRLAAPPSSDSPAAEHKVQELVQEVSTKERSTEPEAAARFSSAQAVSAERHSRHNAGDRYEQEHSHDHRQRQQLDLEPGPPPKTRMPEKPVSTSRLANKAEPEGILPQQGNSVTVNTKCNSPSLKGIVMPSKLSPSAGGCTTEVKALLPETDNSDATKQLQQNPPCTETSTKPVVHELENLDDLSDHSEEKSTKYGSSVERSEIGSDKDVLPGKKQLHVSQESVGKASKSTLPSSTVNREEGEKLVADVPEHSLPCLPSKSIGTKPVLDKMAPRTSEMPTSQSEQKSILDKYDDTASSKSYHNESVLSCLREKKSSAQQGELKSDHIEEASDLADKLMQPEFGVTGGQPQTQAVVVSSENLKKPTRNDRKDEGTLLSFHQMQAIESDVTDKAEKHVVHTTTGTAPAAQSQFEKEIGAENSSHTAVQPVEGAQTESTSLLSKNEYVIVEQIISVSDHAPEHSTDGSRKSAHPAQDLKLSSEVAEGESNVPSNEHVSTKKAENEGPLKKEPQDNAFKPEIVKKEESTANNDYEDRSSTLKQSNDSDDQHALFTNKERVSAMQGDVADTIVFEQSDDSDKHALEVGSDTLQEGVTDIAIDLAITPTLEGGSPTTSLLPNQETMTLGQTELRSHLTEEERRESCSELVSRNEMDVLQDVGADQDYMATPASKGTERESVTNQKWASHELEVADISPIEAVADKSTIELVSADRFGNLEEDTASAGKDHSTVSISSRVEAEPMSLLPREEKTRTELASMKDREEAKSADTPPLEDGVRQLQQSSAVTEHNILADLPTKAESENTQVPVMAQQTDLNNPQERTVSISEEMCVLKVDVPAAQALVSSLTDESGPIPFEIIKFEVPLVHVADEVGRANCGNEEIKTNSGDDVEQPLHKEHRDFTEYEAQSTPFSMAESFSNQAEQAHNLSGSDQSVKEHAAVAVVAPVPNENEILVLTVAEESRSEKSRHDETDYCQQQDHSDENISKPTQCSTPSHKIQTNDEVATIGAASPPCEPKREDDANLQQNTIIQPEQYIISSSFNASAETTLLASSLEEHSGTSAAEAAVVLSTQEEHSVVGLEDIEVATVIEVSAEEIVLSTGRPPTLGSHLTETSQQEYAANTGEQCSLFVSTTEGGVESIDYAVAHPALQSSDQGSVEFLIIGSCNEEHTVVPLAGQQVQDDASVRESADEELGTLPDVAVVIPEAVPHDLLSKEKLVATSTAIIGSSSHLTHSLETELDPTSRPTVPLETRLESQMPPLNTAPQTQLVDSSVVPDERQQSDLKPSSFTASYAESTLKSSEQPTEDSALQPRDADKTLISESSLSSQVVVSPPPTLVGNEEASLNVTSTEESIRVTCSLPPAVTESPTQVEAEKQLVEMMEQAEPAREVMLTGHGELKQREPTHNPMPLRKRLAMRQLRESAPEETPPLPDQQSPSSLSSSVEETTLEEQKPKKAVAKPKRRGRASQALSQGEGDEAETQQVRRSTRNKKAPQRFCF